MLHTSFPHVCIDLTYCHVNCSTLVIKQKLPGIYVQPSYKSALSKDPVFEAHTPFEILKFKELNLKFIIL